MYISYGATICTGWEIRGLPYAGYEEKKNTCLHLRKNTFCTFKLLQLPLYSIHFTERQINSFPLLNIFSEQWQIAK